MHSNQLLRFLLVVLALQSASCAEEEHDHAHDEHSADAHAGHNHGISQADYGELHARVLSPPLPRRRRRRRC